MKIILGSLLLFFVASSVMAQGVRETSGGERYLMTSNAHGYVLTGTNETIYLGRSCDALSTNSGSGSWEWANGGFCVSLETTSICFPRQDVGDGQYDHDIEECRM